MADVTRVDAVYDDNDWMITDSYSRWDCEKCKAEVRCHRGRRDATCGCGAEYTNSGQRLRDDWRGNPSNYNSDIGDMEGYEIQHAGE